MAGECPAERGLGRNVCFLVMGHLDEIYCLCCKGVRIQGANRPAINQSHAQTPPWCEQHPRCTVVHVGETVPSQQQTRPAAGSFGVAGWVVRAPVDSSRGVTVLVVVLSCCGEELGVATLVRGAASGFCSTALVSCVRVACSPRGSICCDVAYSLVTGSGRARLS